MTPSEHEVASTCIQEGSSGGSGETGKPVGSRAESAAQQGRQASGQRALPLSTSAAALQCLLGQRAW